MRGARTTPKLQKIDDHIAMRLTAARRSAGLSQEQASEPIGITFQQLQKYERGTNRVSGAKLALLAETYGVEIGWIFAGAPGLNGTKHTTTDWGSQVISLAGGAELCRAICSLSRERRDLILALALEMS